MVVGNKFFSFLFISKAQRISGQNRLFHFLLSKANSDVTVNKENDLE